MQQDQEQILSEALQKAIQVVEAVEDQYRQAAFPIILQAFIGNSVGSRVSNGASLEINSSQTSELSFPPTMSVNEFFRLANPDTHPARFVTAAYYMLHVGNIEPFNQADILEIYRKLRQPQPKNPTDVISQCIRKVYIIDTPGKDKQKSWTITSAGEKYVEGLINDNSNSKNNGSNTGV